MKSISVVIPNYNGELLLKENLPHLIKSLSSSLITDYEIIIPDDASKDTSCAFIKSNYPQVVLVEGETNLGFAGNINRGIFRATKDLVFLLNSDVALKENYFVPCLKYFEQEDTFGVMGKVTSPDGEVQDVAKYPEIVRLKIKGTINYLPVGTFDNWILTFFLSGGNALVDRKKLLLLNGFDEIYSPYYAEDVDLSLRAWKHGFSCYFEPEAICVHAISSTISKEKKDKVDIIRRRNRFIIHHIHLTSTQLAAWFMINVVKFLSNALLLKQNYVKSYRQYLAKLPEVAARRKELNRSSVMNLTQVKKKILGMLEGRKISKF